MLEYNQITNRKIIEQDGEPWEVIDSNVTRKQQRKPVNQTKLKSLLTGRVTERTFGASEKAEEANIEKREIKYIYNNRGEWWFCNPKDPKDRFPIEKSLIGPQVKFLKENEAVTALVFNDKIIGMSLPVKVELKVVEAPPDVRGNTAQGGNKVVILETGAEVNAPMFIKEGDVVRINTQTGEYTERA
ncbi:MAG: elongation factor P [Parcubacteria group bacterium CG11_big_fil_rev_8_21_14_0_20_39_22]|nr:MAG: elongation factor P [Parcubacteria group bacterium CG11_big_fil_rev_8_21_14_0_20_39_22]